MQAVIVNAFSSDISLQPTSALMIEPEPDHVVVQVVSAGVNYVDNLYAQGKHQDNKARVLPPFTLGLEFSGVVHTVDPGSVWQIGDRVFGACKGSYAEYVSVPTRSLRRIPEGWTFNQAAGLAGTLPVSYKALKANLKRRETVLVHTAAGGLGAMAVQVAAAMGCRVLGTAGSEQKRDFARSLGAECFSNKTDWWEEVLRVTDGRGVDVVFDPAGMVRLSMRCLAQGGRVLVIGFTATQDKIEHVPMHSLLRREATLIGFLFGNDLSGNPDEVDSLWEDLDVMIREGMIRPTVTKTFYGLDKVNDALRMVADRAIVGKAVIRVRQ